MRLTSSGIAIFTIVFLVTASTEKPIAPAFDKVYKHIKQNYTPQPRGSNTPGRDVMLCIMPDEFVQTFQEYAAWKHKSGTFIKIVKFGDIGATSANASCSTAIKPYIQKAYGTWRYRPTFILLVGDAGVFPLLKFISPSENLYQTSVISDEYFGETDFSNKYGPDIMVGRLCVKDTSELRNLLGKIMGYERTPPTTNTAWFRRTIGMSSNQVGGGGSGEGPGLCGGGDSSLQVETVRKTTKMLMKAGYIADTLMCNDQFTGDLNTVIDAINAGASWINYRGQGWAQGWLSDCYVFFNDALPNVSTKGMLPFITGIGCGITMFDVKPGGGLQGDTRECFAELFMRLGTADDPNGAIAVIGPGGETHACWNNAIDLGIYDGVFLYGVESPTPGEALVLGIDSMYKDKQLNIVNTDTADYQARLYLILGDPSTHIWKELPRTAALTGPTAMSVGTSNMTFTVKAGDLPVKDAEVCVSGALADSATWFTGFTDANGAVTLSIAASANENLSLVARGGDILPVERQIIVGTGEIGVHDNPSRVMKSFSLKTICTNPLSAKMTIEYSLPKAGHATITIHSPQGALVQTLVSGMQSAGFHSVEWAGRNGKGAVAPRGVYIISLLHGKNVIRQRMTKIE